MLFDREIVESEPQDENASEYEEVFTVYKICGIFIFTWLFKIIYLNKIFPISGKLLVLFVF